MALSPLDELIAIEEIKKLKARRDRAVDLKDWDTYQALHAPEHVSHNDGYPAWSRDDMMRHVREANRHITLAHHSHTPDITLVSETEATGVWTMEDHYAWMQGEEFHWMRGYGYYHEGYARRDGQWLIVSRRIQRTMLMASPGAVHPTKTAAIAAGYFIGPRLRLMA